MLILMAYNVKIPSKRAADTRENTASTRFDIVASAENNLNAKLFVVVYTFIISGYYFFITLFKHYRSMFNNHLSFLLSVMVEIPGQNLRC